MKSRAMVVLGCVLLAACPGAESRRRTPGQDVRPNAASPPPSAGADVVVARVDAATPNGKPTVPTPTPPKLAPVKPPAAPVPVGVPSPVPSPAASGVLSVALTTWQGCAVRADRKIATWGTPRSASQVTQETLEPGFTRPRVVPGTEGSRQCALGQNHACAANNDGTVRCWGYNSMGQLGDGTIEDRLRPVRVTGITGARKVVVGATHSCALLADGSVRCWGDNLRAQLALSHPKPAPSPLDIGDSLGGRFRTRPKFSGPSASMSPVPIAGLNNVVDLAAFGSRTCAVLAGGAVHCWGAADSRPRPEDAVPQPHKGLSEVRSLALGASHSCAVLKDGTARCWGYSSSGALGGGDETMASDALVTVMKVRGLAGITVGSGHTCAWTKSGALWCWGLGNQGQVGDGRTRGSRLPVRVKIPGEVVWAAAGPASTCAVDRARKLWCWGSDYMGQTAVGSVRREPMPEPVHGLKDAVEVVAGADFACARRKDGTVRCWGDNTEGQLGDGSKEPRTKPVAVSGLKRVTRLQAGPRGVCAIVAGGAVSCWGRLAPGTNAATPRPVAGVSRATALAMGSGGTCAQEATGWRCWGTKTGQTGPADPSSKRVRKDLAGASGVALGRKGLCTWTKAGALTCGPARRPGAKRVVGLPAVRAASGFIPFCTLLKAGTVRCASGRVRDSEPLLAKELVPVAGLSGVVELGAGGRFLCARLKSGEVVCRGSNSSGQLGSGKLTAKRREDVAPVAKAVGLGKAISLGVGGSFACAVVADGRVWCWGANKRGQLGRGTSSLVLTPSEVTAAVTSAPVEAHPHEVKWLLMSKPDAVCTAAAKKWGYTKVRVQCRLLDQRLALYQVVLQGPPVPRGSRTVLTVLHKGGHLRGGGLKVFGTHMARVKAYGYKALRAYDVMMLLDVFEAYPTGFDKTAISERRGLPSGMSKPGLVRKPFKLTLLRAQSPSRGGGGSRGYAPPHWYSATLTGTARYQFSWTEKDEGYK